MLPTRQEGIRILEESYQRNPGPWRDHCMVAAKCAYQIAAECSNLEKEKAYVLGLMHDIGRRFTSGHMTHIICGYDYMSSLGYDEAARICITHSFVIQEIDSYIGNQDVTPEDRKKIEDVLLSYSYDDYDRLIQLCDAISMAEGPAPIEIRMQDVKNRYGRYPQDKWDANIKLKYYFEQKTGKTIEEMVGIGATHTK